MQPAQIPAPARAVTVYSPASQLRSPGALARAMIRDLLAARSLAWRLLVRDIKARYRQTAFGVLWAFFPPLATAATFVVLNRASVINVRTELPYPAFVLMGTFVWQLLVDSVNAPLRIVGSSRGMLARVNFPREALLLAGLGQVLFDAVIRLAILVAVFAWYRITPSATLALTPLAFLVIVLFGTVLGMLLTPVGLLYGDVTAVLPTVIGLWFLLTPVAYPQPEGRLGAIMAANPATPLVGAARDLLTGTLPANLGPFWIVAGGSAVGILVMWVVYRVSIPIIIERLGGA